MSQYKYTFNLNKLQNELVSRSLPVVSMNAPATMEIITSRQLTNVEKTVLARLVIAPFSAGIMPAGVEVVSLMTEVEIF